MAASLAVLVDNKELVKFAPAREGESGVLNLTTMLPRQEHAYVEVYFVRGSLQQRVHTFHLSSLRTDEPRPQIVISAHVRGEAVVTIRVDGELIATERLPLPAEMTRRRTGAWLLGALLALVVIGGGLALWWWGFDGSVPLAWDRSRRPASGAVQERRADAPTTEPETPEPAPPEATPAEGDRTDRPAAEPTDPPATPPGDQPAVTEEFSEPEPIVGLDMTLYFDAESAELTPATRSELEATADAIVEWVEGGGSADALTAALAGHTALYGNEAARLELSRERAQAAAEYLESLLGDSGVDGVSYEIAGFGGREPVARAETQQWRNRRVELTLLATRPGNS